MPFGQTIIYSTTLLAVITVFFFFRKIYRDRIRRIVFPKKVLEEEWEEDRKFNELYQKNKQRELMKQQEMLREKQKDIQVYKDDLEIVDIAKPVGKWTKMVMIGNGLMQRFAQLIHREGGQKGFWELFVKAQASTQGKHKGKGR
ncbi:hypothetical protein wVul_1120 [Wolbachia endosymbiont of Armadillidium vulgare str. wVulC]|uniref:Uncharacterized protein n=1 Tax=Wolbachia endosymbiont of Armadillidium arcangelii TaxID=3158571 RepID=A0AAU7Q4A6_9RICK|nr:hypothetical protein [Wolbachia endosymbiont of Armadillidium vulgare]KLT22186.1 hypothetical protein wVul_1120 [Wolbachia endosymbiont of Armadillidium vulgare str. wVulC]OJH31548.1 hypothetical protein Wxf_00940 [Wolbachia endosymbiont of Armadillidium vulgare]OJH32230.1 hypothetical protein Wxf_01657 [Wolbachia endosymbiont of Armadillidium vulgare]OJH32973.1 hypothetical protein Wxf_02437 [Wolbachia endosymbiont of Armadillidium vulgare]